MSDIHQLHLPVSEDSVKTTETPEASSESDAEADVQRTAQPNAGDEDTQPTASDTDAQPTAGDEDIQPTAIDPVANSTAGESDIKPAASDAQSAVCDSGIQPKLDVPVPLKRCSSVMDPLHENTTSVKYSKN